MALRSSLPFRPSSLGRAITAVESTDGPHPVPGADLVGRRPGGSSGIFIIRGRGLKPPRAFLPDRTPRALAIRPSFAIRKERRASPIYSFAAARIASSGLRGIGYAFFSILRRRRGSCADREPSYFARENIPVDARASKVILGSFSLNASSVLSKLPSLANSA